MRETMTKAGVETHVAEAFAAEQVNILEHHIATKKDIAGIQKDSELLRKDIELLRKDTTALVLETKNDLIKWIVGTMVGTILSLAGIGLALAALLRP